MYNTRSVGGKSRIPTILNNKSAATGVSSSNNSTTVKGESSASTSSQQSQSGVSTMDMKVTNGTTRNITVVPWLKVLLEPVLSFSYDGNMIALDVYSVLSSAPVDLLCKCDYRLGDKIQLLVPYADTTLTWKFDFNWFNPNKKPLIYFGDRDFEPGNEFYQALENWNPKASADCLLSLINILLDDYRKHQLLLCEKQERLKFEVSQLNEPEHHFDIPYCVYTYTEGGRKGDVVFMFIIHTTSVFQLPKKFLRGRVVDDSVRLKIKYTNFGDGKASAEADLSPFLLALFRKKALHLPPMNCMASEYVHAVRDIIKEEVEIRGAAYQFKKDLLTCLIEQFKMKSLLHYNFAGGANKIVFLLEDQDFVFLAKLNFPNAFPISTMRVVLTSVYHEELQLGKGAKPFETRGNVIFTKLEQETATPGSLAEKIKKRLEGPIAEFKRRSCQDGK